ncbi:MAG: hypothetical protein WCV62_04590 [Candidatus Peribacteraceae bacterium]
MNFGARLREAVSLPPALLRVIAEERLSGPALGRLQERKLRGLLFHAFDRSPFYARHWGGSGISRRHLETVPLCEIPPVSKRMLMEHLDEVFTLPALPKSSLQDFLGRKDNFSALFENKYCAVHTSGTSGDFGMFLCDMPAWSYVRSLIIRHVSRPPFLPGNRLRIAFFGATQGHFPGITLLRHVPSLLYNPLYCAVDEPLSRLVPALEAFRPQQLSGYALSIAVLAEAQAAGRLHVQPTSVICSGEPLSAEKRALIRRAFGVEPVNFYACGESLALGVDHDGRGFRMFDEAHVFEILKGDGTAAAPGEEGSVTFTNLYNRIQPLIRYEMKDRLRLSPQQDGKRLLVQGVGGRDVDLVWFRTSDGTMDYIHPSTLVEFYVPNVRKFQFASYRDKLVYRAVFGEGQQEIYRIAEEKLRQLLREKDMQDTVTVSVERVPHLLPDPRTGKFATITVMEPCSSPSNELQKNDIY